jgi:hypothetical protein
LIVDELISIFLVMSRILAGAQKNAQRHRTTLLSR